MEVGMPEEAVNQDFMARCRAIYGQLLPQLLADHRGKVIAIEPESAEYCLGETLDSASEKALVRYPDRLVGFFRIDEFPAVVKLRELCTWTYIFVESRCAFPPGGGRGQEAPAPTPPRQGLDEGDK
jgi:hypothetical protein